MRLFKLPRAEKALQKLIKLVVGADLVEVSTKNKLDLARFSPKGGVVTHKSKPLLRRADENFLLVVNLHIWYIGFDNLGGNINILTLKWRYENLHARSLTG